MTIVEMSVDIDCEGCERKIRKALLKLKGVEDVYINRVNQKVTVTGWTDQKKVLKAVRKTGKTAVLWPYPCNVVDYGGNYAHRYPSAHHDAHHHHVYHAPYSYSNAPYNYHQHGYDESHIMHGYHRYQAQPAYSTVVDDRAGYFFSDDNPNACSVM